MTYYWQAEIPKNNSYYSYNFISSCFENNQALEEADIIDFLDSLESIITNLSLGTFNYTVNDNGSTWLVNCSLEITGVPAQCIPLWMSINTDEESNYGATWSSTLPQTPTPCNECQDLTLLDCTDPELDLDIADGTYTVSIQDHTSGNIYTQSIEVSDGGVDWNGTNTAGVFTPFSVFTVTLQDDNGDPVTWTSGYVDYNCVRLTFTPTINTTPVD